MKIPIYQVDAFTDELFHGNPAAVCPLEKWPDDTLMQKIAAENNLSETAFYVRKDESYEIRWFTPGVEVDLCGHATLASAYVLFNIEGHHEDEIRFRSHRSGELRVSRHGDLLTLDFPSDPVEEIELSDEIASCFDIRPSRAYKGRSDYLLLFESEEDIRKVKPDFDLIEKLGFRGVIITAEGKQSDFVSRFFAPQSGINEDPVTGSAHTTLTPFWHGITGKKEFNAVQLSKRGGRLKCLYRGDRIEISGSARLYLSGSIKIS